MDIEKFLESEDGQKACKYSSMIIAIAAIIIGMKIFGKNIIEENFGDNSGSLTTAETFIYAAIFVSGIIYTFCNTKKF